MPSDFSEDRLFEEALAKQPSPAVTANIMLKLSSGLRPVKPLASNAVLVAWGMAAFAALALSMAAVVGFYGVAVLSPMQRMVVYGVMLMAAALAVTAAVEQMIPGSRRRVPVWLAILFPLAACAVAIPVLFPNNSLVDFVAKGEPCLRMGLLCAVVSSVAAVILMSRGAMTNPVSAGLACGALCGLVGVSVLALHCPILNSMHILTWHLGVLVVSAAAGAAAGWLRSR